MPAQAGGKAGGKTVMPFNGTDLKGWKFQGDPKKSAWVVGRAVIDPDKKNQLKVTVIPPQADGGPGVREMVNPKGQCQHLHRAEIRRLHH
jgi:hypothetical protein